MKNTRYTKWVCLAHLLKSSGGLLACAAILSIAAPPAIAASGAPTVSITSPKNNLVTTNDTVAVSGKAGGGTTNDALSTVTVTVNTSDTPITVTGLNNWQATVPLTMGTNVIQAVSSTASGVQSVAATRTVVMQVFTTISVTTSGNGTVTPNLNGKSLQVGKAVQLRAVPKQDWIFDSWSGDTNSTSAQINFVVQSNSVLAANFVPAPFSLVMGTYNGLITNDTPNNNNSGFITLTTTRNATYSGRVNLGGARYNVSGNINGDGSAPINFPSSSGLTGNIQMDMTNHTGQITGTISGNGFTSPFVADRAAFNLTTNLAPYAGAYNIVLDTNSTVEGFSYMTATVNGGGVVTIAGKLADGSAISQSTSVSSNGVVPFFVSLYNGKGSALGFLQIANTPTTSIAGPVQWFRPDLGKPLYAGGFTNLTTAIGSLFIAPPANVPIMNWTDGVALVGGNDIPMVFANEVTYRSNNTISVDMQLNGFKLTVDKGGILHGSFQHPMTQRTETILGALLPKTNWGGGFFTETNSAGYLYMAPVITDTNLITPPATLEGGTLTLTTASRTGTFKNFAPGTIAFTNGLFADGGTFHGAYNYSSAPMAGVNVVELNLLGGRIGNNIVMVRLLLNFTTDTTGTFLEICAAGSTGVAAGTFTVEPAPAPTPSIARTP